MNSETYFVGVIEGYYGVPWKKEDKKKLFSRMSKMGLNTYMYAPKNDLKHRAYWRKPYNSVELALFEEIIEAAKEQDIMFVYALSPGQDIKYSSQQESTILKNKLSQLASVGCQCFALLFDDIPRNFHNEEDSFQFQSLAKAQCLLANDVYKHLGNPIFFFCPTEYCDSFTYPNITSSSYLHVLGQELDETINVMWTGEDVVSKLISSYSLQTILSIIKRKPIIWDNLHANDYDSSQLYLGPFSGRSVDLISCTSGILSNPNCQLELNFVPFHSLGTWFKAAKKYKDVNDESNLMNKDDFYSPRKALELATDEWSTIFLNDESVEKSNLVPKSDLITIIDLFYLPYEIGPAAHLLLQEFSVPCKAWWNPDIYSNLDCEENMPHYRYCLSLLSKLQSDLLKSENQVLAIEILPYFTNLINVLKLGQKYCNHLKAYGNTRNLEISSLLPFKEDLSQKLYNMLPFVMNNCKSILKEPDLFIIRPCSKSEMESPISFKEKVLDEGVGNIDDRGCRIDQAFVLEYNNKVIGFCGAGSKCKTEETISGNVINSAHQINEFFDSICDSYDTQIFFMYRNLEKSGIILKLFSVLISELQSKGILGVFTVLNEIDLITSIVLKLGFKLLEAHNGLYIYGLKLQ